MWNFYHIPLNEPEDERFLYWDKFGRPNDSIAIYEYMTDGLARVIDSWWSKQAGTAAAPPLLTQRPD